MDTDASSAYECDPDRVQAIELRLIEIWEQSHGEKPAWNLATGSLRWREQVIANDLAVLDIMAFRRRSFIVSRSLLRELSEDARPCQ